MAPSKAESDRIRSSDPGRKIRIVGRIRGFTDQESENLKEDAGAPWISVRKASDGKVAISFGDQSTKDVYEFDNFYQPNQDNNQIFERELKPFIPKVLDGQNVTVIAYGARGSGKTYTLQGNEGNEGLASLAFSEVMSCIERSGNLVAVSFYEVFQDHVHDILDPTHPEIQVLKDAQGRIKLKGLSQIFVKSVSEFQKLYSSDCASLRDTPKKPLHAARRSHKGVIIRVLSNNESSSAKLLGKINFVDLAGYEDPKRMSSKGMNLVEMNKVKESLHTLLKVVYALNANETHVPYRESKLTRLLQDSLENKSHTVIFTCLNPLFCQDTIYATSLASRACQSVSRTLATATKKISSSINQMSLTPSQPQLKKSAAKGRPENVSDSMKKSTTSRANPKKKTPLLVKGRKLFDDEKQPSSTKQVRSRPRKAPVMQPVSLSDSGSVTLPSSQDEEKSTSNTFSTQILGEEVESSVDVCLTTTVVDEGDLSNCLSNLEEVSALADRNKIDSVCLEDGNPLDEENVLYDSSYCVSNSEEVSALSNGNKKDSTCVGDGNNLEKENIDLPMKDGEDNFTNQDIGKEKCLAENEGGSPPLSERLRDLSNYLKSLQSHAPPMLNVQHGTDHAVDDQVVSTDVEEPKTPVLQKEQGVADKWEHEILKTPSETFGGCSTGFKQSFINEYLKFLNTADKQKLRSIRGIGEKRAKYILELREESPQPFKDLDDLKDIGLSSKQINVMLKNVAAQLFT